MVRAGQERENMTRKETGDKQGSEIDRLQNGKKQGKAGATENIKVV